MDCFFHLSYLSNGTHAAPPQICRGAALSVYEDGKPVTRYEAVPQEAGGSFEDLFGDFTFEKYAKIPEQEQLQASITADNLFASMPATFHFLSGAGGWQTELYWHGDGSFSGIYEDADAGESRRCLFTGSMDAPRKIGDLEFSTRVTALDYDKSDTVAYENGQKIVSAKPYGLDGADEIRIYLPGYPVSKLPQAAVEWLCGGAEEFWGTQKPEALPFFVLYNVRGQQAFFSADWSAFSKILSSERSAASLDT